MRIGIDTRMYGPKQGGLGRYIEQLIKNLENIDNKNQYILFFRQDNWDEYTPKNPNFTKVLADLPWYGLKEQIILPHIIKQQKIDLMHFPHWNVPFFYNQPFVVTIHDLIMYHHHRSEASTHGPIVYWLKDKLHRLVLKSAAKRAQKIITPSEFSKNDIHQTLNISLSKIFVTLLAPTALQTTKETKLAKEITPPFALYVGNSYPHKNLTNLIKAWKNVEENTGWQLVLVGKENFFYKKLLDSKEFKETKKIVYLGYQSDTALSGLYQNAGIYVFPSLYEGFGLPPLEAIAEGVPVASSQLSCLPEILKKSAYYFDPSNPVDMSTKITQLINDKNLQEKLKNEGKNLLKNYSWDTTARQTQKIYTDGG